MTICELCGNPAQGFATINDDRYCHGDEQDVTCYELAQWKAADEHPDEFPSLTALRALYDDIQENPEPRITPGMLDALRAALGLAPEDPDD